MKKIKFVLLAFVMSFVSLVGCDKNNTDDIKIKEYGDYYKGVELDKVVDYVVKNGNSDYKIVVSANAGEAVRYAASEMVDFVSASTGVIIQCVTDMAVSDASSGKYISLGNTSLYQQSNIQFDYNTLNGDGFIMKTVDDDLYINAYRDRGILYGAYDFLEKFLGVRFLTYDDTHIPKNTEVALYQMDVVEIPAFAMRTYLQGAVYGGLANPEYYARSRTNNDFTVVSEKYGGNANLYGRNNTHNFHCYVPREVYYESHPEFYHYDALWDIGGDNGWTIDLLNGITDDGKLDESMEISVAKIVIEEMKKDIIAKPDVDFFIFEQEDGLIYYPYKPGSKQQQIVDKYGRSGIMVRFCNVIARELQDWANKELNGRQIKIVTFAYSYTKDPPVRYENGKPVPIDSTVVAADNLVIRMAMAGNRYYSYFDERSEQVQRIEGWTTISKNYFFWGYEADYVEYLWYMPFFNLSAQDPMAFSEYNIFYMLNQGVYDDVNNWMSHMKGYIYSKLYWNPKLNVQALLEEYLTLYYDVAAPYVKEMIYLFEENYAIAFANDPELNINVTQTGGYRKAEICSIKLLEKTLKCITDAETLVKQQITDVDEQQALLVKLARVKATPMRMIMKYYQSYYPIASQSQEVEFAKEFFATCEFGGVTKYAEALSINSLKSAYKLN